MNRWKSYLRTATSQTAEGRRSGQHFGFRGARAANTALWGDEALRIALQLSFYAIRRG
jgi:hypothetical protein